MDNINHYSEQTDSNRRLVIIRTLQIVGVATTSNLLATQNAMSQETQERSVLSETPARKEIIEKAFEMKRTAIDSGDQGYGAIIVKKRKIVGLGPSKVIINYYPTAHAEMEAIRDACRNLKTNDLTGCDLYSTSKPCRMCETAGYWAKISRMYFGVDIVDGGIPQYPLC